MDFESTDRWMSGWFVTATRNGTQFLLTDEGMASDIKSRARWFRWEDQAESAAQQANGEYAWEGFDWTPIRVAAF